LRVYFGEEFNAIHDMQSLLISTYLLDFENALSFDGAAPIDFEVSRTQCPILRQIPK
jgi:hypothetical protein